VCVLSQVRVIFCDECDAATTRCERGWRAYLTARDAVTVLCPACAERVSGEDEPPAEE